MIYLTAKDIADRWQVNVRTVERKLQAGELPAMRFGPRIVRRICSSQTRSEPA